MFQFKQGQGFPAREEEILAFWQGEKIFEKSLEANRNKPLFSFYDGPPFATGLPHYGHLLAGTIKDVFPRYKTMKGYYVPRRFGWDCHGLPIENEIEKAQELSGAHEIERFGIAKFNQECASIVFRYTQEWKKTVDRMGRWVDFSRAYRTMDVSFMESVWWVFQQLYNRGLIYEGFKVMPFSTKLGTPLSNFEANLNYKEVQDPSIVVCFPVKGEESLFLLAWTTTPWTLVSNLALAVSPKIEYVKIRDFKTDRKYILARDRLSTYFKDHQEYEVLATFKGKLLANQAYEPLFPYFAKRKDAFRVLVDDFVSTEDGTGIVHMAPAFGEEDFFVCKREGIEPECPVDGNGRYTEEIHDYAGMLVKDADKLIMRRLKEAHLLFHQSQITHRYPFCWRSDTPLIYKAVHTWFVAVEKMKERIVDANQQITWMPEHIKEGRFGKWLENARDWAISRNRYWGTPIPIWRNANGDCVVIGSVKELETLTGKKISNLHREFVDSLTFQINGLTYHRIPEVLDCWFESGSMPYGQNHYPFEKKEETESSFPADFIAEGLDQTRGWFYTLHVLSVALFDKPSFKNVIVNGIILAEDGTKMSKRLKNYPDPTEVIQQYGADALRYYLLSSPAVKAEDLCFSQKGVEQIVRQLLLPLWSSYCFLATYATIYQWDPSSLLSQAPKGSLDRWVLSLAYSLAHEVEEAMEAYDLNRAVEPLLTFVDQLTNWYIRRSRARFWAEEDTQDRREGFATLYQVLLLFSKVAAPFIPFIAEAIYRELRTEEMESSVHLCTYPAFSKKNIDKKLEEEMSFVQRVVSLGHALRKEHKIKVRQPLARADIVAANGVILLALEKQQQLIAEELNVKEIFFHSDEARFVSLYGKPNFRVLGKKVGALLPQVQAKVETLSPDKLKALLLQQSISIQVGDQEILLTPEDVLVERKVLEGMEAGNDSEITIAFDTKITPELRKEGLARELVNKMNTIRREKGFAVSDRIFVALETSGVVQECFEAFQEYICGETLTVRFSFGPCEGEEWDLNGEKAKIAITRAPASYGTSD